MMGKRNWSSGRLATFSTILFGVSLGLSGVSAAVMIMRGGIAQGQTRVGPSAVVAVVYLLILGIKLGLLGLVVSGVWAVVARFGSLGAKQRAGEPMGVAMPAESDGILGSDEARPVTKLSMVARATIGMALSVIAGVVALMVGINQLCGHGGGFNEGSTAVSPGAGIAIGVLYTSIASFFCCFVWMVVELIRIYDGRTEE